MQKRQSLNKRLIKTKKGIDLTKAPFNEYQNQISSKKSYEYSQPLGTHMREAGIEAFLFESARAKQPGINVAAYAPEIFIKEKDQYISSIQNWRCLANKNVIEFTRIEILARERWSFSKDDFE
ncbi:hypothetical protein [Legionella feeleii]|nr:hypothetical protein [Legionella feeleii]